MPVSPVLLLLIILKKVALIKVFFCWKDDLQLEALGIFFSTLVLGRIQTCAQWVTDLNHGLEEKWLLMALLYSNILKTLLMKTVLISILDSIGWWILFHGRKKINNGLCQSMLITITLQIVSHAILFYFVVAIIIMMRAINQFSLEKKTLMEKLFTHNNGQVI